MTLKIERTQKLLDNIIYLPENVSRRPKYACVHILLNLVVPFKINKIKKLQTVTKIRKILTPSEDKDYDLTQRYTRFSESHTRVCLLGYVICNTRIFLSKYQNN